MGFFQSRILEWVATSSSRGSSWPKDQTSVSCVSCNAGRCFTHWAIGEAQWEGKYTKLWPFSKDMRFALFNLAAAAAWMNEKISFLCNRPYHSTSNTTHTLVKAHPHRMASHYTSLRVNVALCVCVLVTQSCPTLCDPTDCSPPGFSVHGILQARILEWIAIPFSRGTSQPRDWTQVSCLTGRFFTIWATGKSNVTLPFLFSFFKFI